MSLFPVNTHCAITLCKLNGSICLRVKQIFTALSTPEYIGIALTMDIILSKKLVALADQMLLETKFKH